MQDKKVGRPQTPTRNVAQRVPGMPRFSIEIPEAMLRELDRSATQDQRSRVAQVRVLLGEALKARKDQKNISSNA